MAVLSLKGIAKTFGSVTAVAAVDLDVPASQFVCFLGPSGCGKTTLLRLIAGLEAPSAGTIHLGDRDLTPLSAHERNLGMVFQSLALFPHLTVWENIAYGLRIRGMGRAQQRLRADALLDLVQLPGVGDRQITQLSGGQRQRVAIARALALEPSLFLMDEPLSALDAKLREAMQVELRQLQQRLGITTILVTHDQREAMTMADLVVVMSQGRIQQVGSPLDIYKRPANAFVADFIGTTNLYPARLAHGRVALAGGVVLRAEEIPGSVTDGDAIMLSVRPEDVVIAPAGADVENPVDGTIGFIRDVGQSVEIYVDGPDGLRVTCHSAPQARPDAHVGDRVRLSMPAAACVVLAS